MSAVPDLIVPNTKLDAAKALGSLRGFLGPQQLRVVGDCCRGEEKQYFFDKLVELAALVESMPKVYEQDGLGEQAIVYLHYFIGGCDWFITEKDSEREQHQAFGWANLGDDDCAELGYISLIEITAAGAELDFNFKPRSLAEAKEKK
jgi:hypothetical protein